MGNKKKGRKKRKNKAKKRAEAKKGAKKRPKKKCKKKEEKCPLKNQIVAVEILDGGKKAAEGTVKQYVNLPRDPKWLDGSKIKNTDRLSEKFRIRVRFKKPGRENFGLKLIPDGGNATYSAGEKSRNGKYNYTSLEKRDVTDADGTKIIEDVFRLAAAGGDTYYAEAKDDYGNKVSSTPVETIRRLYLQEITTKGLPALPPHRIGAIEQEFQKKHHTEIVRLPSVQQTAHDGKIRETSDSEDFKRAVRGAYARSEAKKRKPYAIVLVHLHSITYRRYIELDWHNRKVGPGVNDIVLPLSYNRGAPNYLWADRSGQVRFNARFIPRGADKSKAVEFRSDRMRPVTASTGPADKYDRVRLKVHDLTRRRTRGTIQVIAYVVDMTPGGISYYDSDMIGFCRYTGWQKLPEEDYSVILVHEVGHKIGMVSDGTDLDKGDFHYDQATGGGRPITSGWGPHCYCGLPPPSNVNSYDIGTKGAKEGATFDIIDVDTRRITKERRKPKCVMFGFVGSTTSFCPDCRKDVRKKDLSNPQAWKNWKSRYYNP